MVNVAGGIILFFIIIALLPIIFTGVAAAFVVVMYALVNFEYYGHIFLVLVIVLLLAVLIRILEISKYPLKFILNLQYNLFVTKLFFKYRFLRFSSESHAHYSKYLELEKKRINDLNEEKIRLKLQRINDRNNKIIKNKIFKLSKGLKKLEKKINRNNIFIFNYEDNKISIKTLEKHNNFQIIINLSFIIDKYSDKNKYYSIESNLEDKFNPDKTLNSKSSRKILNTFATIAGKILAGVEKK
tara:strand:+ start:129 stop:854 length:726 start_codon:yes stop_codon:yes gene_type:complete